MKLNVGCGTHYAEGWVNTDMWSDETTRPDVVTPVGEPYPFDDHSADAIYMGHVLEHIAWANVPPFLLDIRRIAKPGAPILVVGPDVWRTIHRWRDGKEPWHMVESVLEHQDNNFQPGREHLVWEGAPHHWNCHEMRVASLLADCGYVNIRPFTDIIPNDTNGKWWTDDTGITWPVVGKWHWQFALLCNAP